MGRLILVLFALLLAACEPPALPATGERYVIAFEDDVPGAPTAWRPEHRRALSALTTILAPTGATFRFGTTSEAHLILRTFDSGARCEHGGGYYEVGTNEVFIDYACAHGDPQLLTVCGHEVLHWYEWKHTHARPHHICLAPRDESDCWTGEYGESVLNPWLGSEFDPEGNPLGPRSFELNEITLRFVRTFQ
jgi:hypothetical protein